MEPGKYVCIGLCVTSHSDGDVGVGRLDNLSMSTPDPRKSWGPDPRSGTENVPIYATLSWGAGTGASQHKVYFDMDPDNLSLIATLPAEQTTIDVGPLLLDQKYYWKVNEVIINSDPCEIEGDVWNFTTETFLVVEDFESYAPVQAEPLPEQVVVGGDYYINPVEPDAAGLLAMYDFEGDANDRSGNGNDGTLIGDADVSTGVLQVDGDGDCVDIGANPAFNFAGNFTLSAWVKLNSWGGCWGNVIVGKRGEGGLGWQLRRFGCDPRFSFTTRGMGNDDNPRSNLEPAMGEWYHLTAVRDGTIKLLYINGNLDSTAGINSNPVNACDHNVYIGARANGDNSGPESFFDGAIDDLRIYNYALSEGEARYLADADPRYVPPEYGPLKAHYEFEGNYDDTSGNNKHLTPYGDISLVTDPEMGNVVSLPGGSNQYLGAGSVGVSGNIPRTIAGWAKADSVPPDWTLLFGFTLVGGCDQHFNVGSIGGPGGIGAHVWCWEATILTDAESYDWHHYAMTYDGTTVKGYGDAKLYASGNRNLNTPDNFQIGSRATQDSSFPGDLDDVRVYDVELTQGQIVSLAYENPVMVNEMNKSWEYGSQTELSIEWSRDIVHWGLQSLKADNVGTGGHLQRKFKPAADWTPGEPKALVMWYKGDADVRDLYVQLENPTDGSYPRVFPDKDVVDLKSTDWQALNFELSDFGVDLDEIHKIIVKLKPEKWQKMTVYFDDIRLYPSRCVPEYGPYADFTGDCLVDNKDLRVLVTDWLPLPGQGLRYEYYEGSWSALPDFGALTPVKVGTVSNFDIGVRNQNDNFAFRFTGEIAAPADANYTFYTSSDDGSKLYIDDIQVVDNDGLHGPQWREGTIYLTAGQHKIVVTMFELGGGEQLLVEVESAEAAIPRIPIPDDVLSITEDVLELVPTMVDLTDDGNVNLKDYGTMLEEWLLEKLWP
jgi:hypothetical protein